MDSQTRTVKFNPLIPAIAEKEEARLAALRREGWRLREMRSGEYLLEKGGEAGAVDLFFPALGETGGIYFCETHGRQVHTAADSATEWLHAQDYRAERFGEGNTVLVLHGVPERAVTHLRWYRAFCRYREMHNTVLPVWGLLIQQIIGQAVGPAFGGKPDTVWCALLVLTLPLAVIGTVRLVQAKREYRRLAGDFTPARDGTAASLLQFCRSAELPLPEQETGLPVLPEPALLDFWFDLRHYLTCCAECGRQPDQRRLRRILGLLMQSKPRACGRMRRLARNAQKKRVHTIRERD